MSRPAETLDDRRQRLATGLRLAGIPERYHSAKLSPAAPKIVEAWLAHLIAGTSSGPLVLTGPVGVGKTWLACAALKRWVISTGRPGAYITAADYSSLIRSTWGKRSDDSETAIQHRHASVPLLVLDDLGAGGAKDLDIAQALIDARYMANRTNSLIISTNIHPGEFDGAFGQRMADRLRDAATVLQMSGPSRRTVADSQQHHVAGAA